MNRKMKKQGAKTAECVISRHDIMVVGSNEMQNELLLSFLRAQTEFDCSSCLPSDFSDMLKGEATQKILFLIDAQSTGFDALVDILAMEANAIDNMFFVATYNVDAGADIDTEALDRGLHGVFNLNTPLVNIAKGVKAILAGDYWFPRKCLSAYIRQQRTASRLRRRLTCELTPREREVLLKIYAGACNKEIADDLCISFHTVKTHVYNIFTKLGANNRFQAALWAAENL